MKMLNIIMIILTFAAIALLVGCAVPVEAQDIYFLPNENEDIWEAWQSRSHNCGLNDPGDVDMIGSPWDKLAAELNSSGKEFIIVCGERDLEQVAGFPSEKKDNLLLINILTTKTNPFRTSACSPMFLMH